MDDNVAQGVYSTLGEYRALRFTVRKVLFIDVTETLSLNRFTGVQKVLSLAVKSEVKTVLVRASPQLGGYVPIGTELDFLPRKTDHRQLLNWRTFARIQILDIWIRRVIKAVLPFVAKLVRTLSTFLYSTVVRSAVPVVSGKCVPLPKDEPIDVWLLDVPRDARHLDFLEQQIERKSIRLNVYIYDLIPLDQESELGISTDPDDLTRYRRYLKLSARACSRAFLSHTSRARWLNHILTLGFQVSDPGPVIYPPTVPMSRHPVEYLSTGDLRTRTLPIPENPFVLALAPFNRRKNLGVLLEAFEQSLQAGEHLGLVIVAPVRADTDVATIQLGLRLEKKFREQVRIFRPLPQADIDQLFRDCSVVAVPSLLEGYGLPIVEACQLGKPVVASDIPVFRELQKSLNFVCVPPKDPEAWRLALQTAAGAKASQPKFWPINSSNTFAELLCIQSSKNPP